MKKPIYIFIKLEVTVGEHIYFSKTVHALTAGDTTKKFSKLYASEFLTGTGKYNKNTNLFEFPGGETVEIHQAVEISEQEFYVLNKFI